MAKAIAFTRSKAASAQEYARIAIVSFCGVALIVAGQFLPL
ncbi:hypothetical protein [Aurantiacibacter sp. D1-12]|nr:hypothetical protein [Aurantiacibacter sp. D1-12]MDE1468249.1 hypothetical protein [Aurantiacibacter sp. D1-12]